MSKIESLNKELKKLGATEGIIGSAIVNRNGLLITSRLTRDIGARKFGAMTATMFGAIETATTTLGSDKVHNLVVELNDCQIIVLGASEKIIIASLVDLNINLGLILIEMEETIKKIKEIWLR